MGRKEELHNSGLSGNKERSGYDRRARMSKTPSEKIEKEKKRGQTAIRSISII
jgi:hypothetical protein